MKRLFKVIAALILTIITALCAIEKVYASEYDIKITSPDSVNVGKSFTAYLSLPTDQAHNISALKIIIEYSNDNLNFKGADCPQGETDYCDENGKVTVICLFTDGIPDGDSFLSLSFTARTEQSGSRQKMYFQCTEAVDNSLKSLSVSVTDSLEIEITKSTSDTNPSVRANASKYGDTNGGGKTSSKNVSSKTGAAGSKNSSGRDKSNSKSERQYEEENPDLPSIGYLANNNGKSGYLFAGIGIGFSVVAVIFISYKVGRTDRLKHNTPINEYGEEEKGNGSGQDN